MEEGDEDTGAWQDADDEDGEDSDDDFDIDEDEKVVGVETKARVVRLLKTWAASPQAQQLQGCFVQLPTEQQDAMRAIFE